MKRTKSRYPTFKKRIAVKHALLNDIEVNATIDIDFSKPIVAISQSSRYEIVLRPIEAERLGRALLTAAKIARAKVKR